MNFSDQMMLMNVISDDKIISRILIFIHNCLPLNIIKKINLTLPSQNFPLPNTKMIFKLSYNNQTHLYNKSISLQNLQTYCSKIFRDLPSQYTFIYMSPKGEMTYIETDADLIGLKYVCSSTNDMIVKLHIVKNQRFEHFDIDEDIETRNIVRENLQEMAENVFTRLEDEEETEAIEECVSEYLDQTYSKIASDIAKAENLMADKEVHKYLFNLYENTARAMAQTEHSFIVQKPRKRKAVRFSPEKPVVHKIEKSIDQVVNEKVLSLIPALVDKIYAKMESKLNNRCKNCLKKEIDIENAIDEEINRKISQLCNDQQNPEQ